jgi:hypothetical protein
LAVLRETFMLTLCEGVLQYEVLCTEAEVRLGTYASICTVYFVL